MEISDLLGGLASAASGGLFGIFGTGIKMWAQHKAEEAKRQFELAMRKADREEMQLEHDLQMKTIEAQTERDVAVANQQRLSLETQVAGDIAVAETKVWQESYGNDKATYGGGFVDGVRGMMRPVITLYFAVLMSVLTYQLIKLNGGAFVNATEAQAMLKEIINAIIFLTTTAVTWWFGSRPVKRG